MQLPALNITLHALSSIVLDSFTQEDKKALPDNVKVTGRHALCTDCVAAYAQHLGTPPEGDAP